jgi:hypothetical protein
MDSLLQAKERALVNDQQRLIQITANLKGQIESLEETLALREKDLYATNGALNMVRQLMGEWTPVRPGPVEDEGIGKEKGERK